MSGLNAATLDNTLKDNPFYRGTYPCDRLKDCNLTSLPCGLIVNFDKFGEPGSHWVGIWFNKNQTVEYFDSYSRPFSINKYIYNFIQDNGYNICTQIIGKALQNLNTSVCGHYTLLFIVNKSRGKTYGDFYNIFSDQSKSGYYDKLVEVVGNDIIKKETVIPQSVGRGSDINYICDRVKLYKSVSCKCDPLQCCVSRSKCLKLMSKK